jgi:YHS domain-containing protein
MKRMVPVALVLSGVVIAGTVAAVLAVTKKDGSPTVSRAYLHSYNLPSSGVALEGYCPVSYFVAGKAVRGKPEHASTHDGVTYYFASADGKRAFDADPAKYVPDFGGWCAFGMAIEDKFPIDPTAFKIVDGRLMLFLRNASIDALELWNKNDESEQLAKAEAHWKKVSR